MPRDCESPTPLADQNQVCKVLILSVGSLLGQCLLDVLAGRRQHVRVIGLNSQAQNPCQFKCDKVYLTPQLDQPVHFTQRLLEILESEKPQLILPGRDQDVLFLAGFREAYPAFAAQIPCGASAAVKIVNDKYLTWEWACSQNLPFAHSYLLTAGNQAQCSDILAGCRFPLIAKPRMGFGSQGVCYVLNPEGLMQLDWTGSVLLQEYLGDESELLAEFARFDAQYRHNLPLFFQIPETRQFAAQTLIGPDGRQGPVFCSQSTLVMGRTEAFRQVFEPELETLLNRYVQALAGLGWCGSVNLQAKPDAAGIWKAFELNLRMTGGTSSRLHFGFDEFALLMQAFYPEWAFPLLKGPTQAGTVLRRLEDHFVPDAWVSQLESEGCWIQADHSA